MSFGPLNVTTLVDALDEDRSELMRSPSTGRILNVERAVFRASALEGVPIFKVPQFARGSLYVADPVVELVRGSGLKGLDFDETWSAG